MVQACDRAIRLGFDDLKLRAASWVHDCWRFGVITLPLKARRDRGCERLAHIQIVGDRQNDAGLRRLFQTDACGNQTPAWISMRVEAPSSKPWPRKLRERNAMSTRRRAVLRSAPDSRQTISASMSGAG